MNWKNVGLALLKFLVPLVVGIVGTQVWQIKIGESTVVLELKARLAEMEKKQNEIHESQKELAGFLIAPSLKK